MVKLMRVYDPASRLSRATNERFASLSEATPRRLYMLRPS